MVCQCLPVNGAIRKKAVHGSNTCAPVTFQNGIAKKGVRVESNIGISF
jgi:hypothetical protein